MHAPGSIANPAVNLDIDIKYFFSFSNLDQNVKPCYHKLNTVSDMLLLHAGLSKQRLPVGRVHSYGGTPSEAKQECGRSQTV